MKRILKVALIAAIFINSSGCGKTGDLFDATIPTGSDPILTRTTPTSARAGDTVTIFGIGFSIAAELNIVVIGDTEVAANSYTLLANPSGDEVESITFVVPAGITPDTYTIYVIVIDNPSNVDLTITITP